MSEKVAKNLPSLCLSLLFFLPKETTIMIVGDAWGGLKSGEVKSCSVKVVFHCRWGFFMRFLEHDGLPAWGGGLYEEGPSALRS